MEKYKLGNHRFTMPSSWQDINFRTGMKILSEKLSELQLMALLSGIPEKELEESTDLETIYHFIGAFTYLTRLPANVENPEMPNSVKFGDRLVIFPFVLYADKFDLGKCSVGQVKDMEMIISQKTKEITDGTRDLTELELLTIMPYVVAIYFQSLLDQKYDYDKAMKLVPEIEEKLSFKELINIGYFFFRRLIALNNGLSKGHRKQSSMIKKLKRGFWSLTQRLASTRH
jgi:hypothetical protein